MSDPNLPWNRSRKRVVVKEKAYWQSKVFWFNILTGITLVLATSDVVAVLPKEGVPYIGASIAIINIVLRLFFTDSNLTMGRSSEDHHGS